MDRNINRLTYHTLRWIFTNKHDSRYEMCESPAQMKGLTYKILGVTPGTDISYDKGNRLIDFVAIFDWFNNYKKGKTK